jgi:hypothetical protein
MSGLEDRDTRASQVNQASGKSRIYANQGSGNQSINHTYHTNVNARTRMWTGWAVLIILIVDIAFFFYGKEAYTGHAGDSGDNWRAGIFLVLLATTGTLIRRWFRSKL